MKELWIFFCGMGAGFALFGALCFYLDRVPVIEEPTERRPS